MIFVRTSFPGRRRLFNRSQIGGIFRQPWLRARTIASSIVARFMQCVCFLSFPDFVTVWPAVRAFWIRELIVKAAVDDVFGSREISCPVRVATAEWRNCGGVHRTH